MPENKLAKEKRESAELHSLIANSNGFRVSKADFPKVGHHLKELERKGFILFAPGVGWVDSTPALRRYKDAMGLDLLIGPG